MSNMSYCRFQNTFKDLQEVVDDWGSKTLSKTEDHYRNEIYELALTIVDMGLPEEEYDDSEEDENSEE